MEQNKIGINLRLEMLIEVKLPWTFIFCDLGLLCEVVRLLIDVCELLSCEGEAVLRGRYLPLADL